MKKSLIIILSIVIPVIAITAYLYIFASSMSTANVSRVILETSDGGKYVYSKKEDKKIFIDLLNNIDVIDKQEFDKNVYTLYTVTYESLVKSEKLYLCMSGSVKNCIAYDEKGVWYRIDPDFAGSLLLHESIKGVDSLSDLPTLTVKSGTFSTEIAPASGEWYYLLADGSFEKVIKKDEECNATATVVSNIGSDFIYSANPDYADVKIYKDAEVLFDGKIDDLFLFTHDKDEYLDVVINAEWYEKNDALFYGKTESRFKLFWDAPCDITISSENVYPGEAVYLILKNALNEDFTVSTDITDKKINVYDYGTGKLALVPVSADTEIGMHSITVNSDRNSIPFSVNVKGKALDSANIVLSDSLSADDYIKAFSGFDNEIKSAFEEKESDVKWDDGFACPINKFNGDKETYWVSAPAFGTVQNVNGNTTKLHGIGANFVKSIDADSLSIKAVCDGTVVFAGRTKAFGNVIVVSHGLGVYSVYGHIDFINYKVGESIMAGDVVGKSSKSEYTLNGEGVFFGISICGEFVNPYNFISEPASAEKQNLKTVPFDFTSLE